MVIIAIADWAASSTAFCSLGTRIIHFDLIYTDDIQCRHSYDTATCQCQLFNFVKPLPQIY